MSIDITLKHSSTTGKTPTDLKPGEVAINTADVKAYIKDKDGNIVQLAGPGSDIDAVKKSGDTMTGALYLPSDAPTVNTEAVNKKYVDDEIAVVAEDAGKWTDDPADGSIYPKAAGRDVKVGGILPGDPNLILHASDGSATFSGGIDVAEASVFGSTVTLPVTAPVSDGQAVNKKYVDDVAANAVISGDAKYVKIAGDNMNGNLTLGTNQITLDATNGNAEFASGVDSGLYFRVTSTNDDFAPFKATNEAGDVVFDVSGVGAIAAAGDVKIGGILPSAPNILLNAETGAAAFAGGNAEVLGDGALRIKRSTGNGSLGIGIFADNSFSANATAAINTDGSATFTGGYHTVNKEPNSTFSIYNAVSPANGLADRYFFKGTANGTDTVTIGTDGSAVFAGLAHFGDAAGVLINGGPYNYQGKLDVCRDGGINPVWQGWVKGTNEPTSEIFANGSAKFYSFVQSGGNPNSGASNGAYMSNEGYVAASTGSTAKAYYAFTTGNSSPQFYVTGGGNYYFAGTGQFSNAFINLEADDDTKYTTTTDADGNESRVYNGATLDIKDRLTKTDAALQALKTAAAAAIDFAALKSAIATALADI